MAVRQMLGYSIRKAKFLYEFGLGRIWGSEIIILHPMPDPYLFTYLAVPFGFSLAPRMSPLSKQSALSDPDLDLTDHLTSSLRLLLSRKHTVQ
jgi:hypothetical protein